MAGKGLTPPTTRKSSWKPRQKRQFMLESDVLPDEKVQKAEGTRFVMIRFEGSNGKAYQYKKPIQVMDF